MVCVSWGGERGGDGAATATAADGTICVFLPEVSDLITVRLDYQDDGCCLWSLPWRRRRLPTKRVRGCWWPVGG